MNQVQPSEADWTEPQEGSFGDEFRKAPKGQWRKARGSTHSPALAKVGRIIESLFLSFHFFTCTDEDGGRETDGEGVGSRWSIPGLVRGRGWPRTFLSICYSHRSLGKEQRKNDKDTDMLGTHVRKYTHAAFARGSR